MRSRRSLRGPRCSCCGGLSRRCSPCCGPGPCWRPLPPPHCASGLKPPYGHDSATAGPARPTATIIANKTFFIQPTLTPVRGAALAFDSGLAALRNREKPKVSLRNLPSLGAALAFDSGLAALRNREKPKVSLRNLPSLGAALAFDSGLAALRNR